MGQMRFLAPQRDRVSREMAQRAYMAGIEGIPWHSRNSWQNDELVVQRELGDSGNLHVPWIVEGHGEVVLCTSSLMERRRTYNLPVELARGTISRVRNQVAAWQGAGLTPGAEFTKIFEEAQRDFIRSAALQLDPPRAASEAEAAIRCCLDAVDLLGRQYAREVLTIRHQQIPRLNTLLAGALGSQPLSAAEAEGFLSAFNTAAVAVNWKEIERQEGKFDWTALDKQIEWCRVSGLKICAGPLVRLNKAGLPDWLYLWEDDFDNLQSYVLQFVAAVVERYRGKVHIWHCAAGMNVGGAIDLSEEHKLRLTVALIDAVRRADQRTPAIVSFDQPWAEYMGGQAYDLSPLHFADALVRAELGLAGIGLEMNFGYWPGGTWHRDLLEVNRLLDSWSLLGLPLLVLMTVPSGDDADPRAAHQSRALPQSTTGGNTPQTQAAVAERLVPLLVAKQSIHGIIWNQLCDADPHDFPHGGVFDSQHASKPVLATLAAIRREHLL